MAWHGSLFGARYAPSLVFSYDLAGLEKAGDLATAKRFLSQFPDGALSSNSGCPFSPNCGCVRLSAVRAGSVYVTLPERCE